MDIWRTSVRFWGTYTRTQFLSVVPEIVQTRSTTHGEEQIMSDYEIDADDLPIGADLESENATVLTRIDALDGILADCLGRRQVLEDLITDSSFEQFPAFMTSSYALLSAAEESFPPMPPGGSSRASNGLWPTNREPFESRFIFTIRSSPSVQPNTD